jgi:hypothetical protein
MNRIFILSIISLFGLFLTNLSAQKQDTIYASYQYLMGDSDTKTDARQISFLEAKRLCLEQAGTFIESQVKVENYQVTQDDITTYSASFLQVELVSEETKVIGESMAIITTVRAIVDPVELRGQIGQLKADKELEKQVLQEAREQQELEKQTLKLRDELQRATPEQRENLRKQLAEAFQRLQNSEDKKQRVKTATRSAIEMIKPGMTAEEVLKVAGAPLNKIRLAGDLRLNYGMVWVIFNRGKVTCLVKAVHFKPTKQCRDYTELQKIKR